MSHGTSLRVIFGSLAANLGIAAAKGVAAFITGSGAMLGEAMHSLADCMNQVLLLVGSRQAASPPDERHPMGKGREAYFWSFLVALMIFVGGGIVAMYEGIEKIRHPEPVEHVWAGAIVLVVALVLESLALAQATRALSARRGTIPFFRYLAETPDADLVVLFAENSSDVIGLVLALGALVLAVTTGDTRWDGIGSVAIGALLCVIATFLAREVKSLLAGERADPAIEAIFREEAARDAKLGGVLRVITVQQGPAQVMLAAKVEARADVSARELAEAINALEDRVRGRRADVRWQFIEPDVRD